MAQSFLSHKTIFYLNSWKYLKERKKTKGRKGRRERKGEEGGERKEEKKVILLAFQSTRMSQI